MNEMIKSQEYEVFLGFSFESLYVKCVPSSGTWQTREDEHYQFAREINCSLWAVCWVELYSPV